MNVIDVKSHFLAQIFLKRVRSLLATNEFQLSMRDKNQDFVEKYKISYGKIKEMLLALDDIDCINVCSNNNPRYRNAIIYKFIKKYQLEYFGDICDIEVYIKLYIVMEKTYDLVMIISFHENDEE